MAGRTAGQMVPKKKAFLDAFRQIGIVKAACEQADIGRSSIYRWQETDDTFAAAFRQAEIEATETMEAEAYRRGMRGTPKPVFHQGAQCGTIQEFSDLLLIFMLKARAPDKYRDKQPAPVDTSTAGLDVVIDERGRSGSRSS